LHTTGSIIWNVEKLMDRMVLRIPEICENCNLLPACGGICSQQRLEKGKYIKCKLDSDFTKDDYIIHNLNRQLLINKIKALQE
jgi:sulfatase maturation enzyme AslB (radical SAM superfamily)